MNKHGRMQPQTIKTYTNLLKILTQLEVSLLSQDVIINRSTVDNAYYQSAKRFLLIINLLGFGTEIRRLLIDDLKKIPNFHLNYHSLSPEEQENMVSHVKSIQKWAAHYGINLELAFLLEFSEYIFTKQFIYNSHILYQLLKREEKIWERRVGIFKIGTTAV